MSVTRKAPAAARILLGLIFVIFGLNFFLHFIPLPPPEGAAGAFLGALFASGYVMQLVKVVEVGAGLLLLANRFVPLALALLAPIIVNIVGFHVVLAPGPQEMAMPVVILALEIYLAWSYRDSFRPMLAPVVSPAASTEAPSLAAPHRAA